MTTKIWTECKNYFCCNNASGKCGMYNPDCSIKSRKLKEDLKR